MPRPGQDASGEGLTGGVDAGKSGSSQRWDRFSDQLCNRKIGGAHAAEEEKHVRNRAYRLPECSRREFLKIAGIAGAAVGVGAGLGGLLAACGEEEVTTTTAGEAHDECQPPPPRPRVPRCTGAEAGREIKVGFVDPITGAIAGFGIPGKWCVERWREAVTDGLLCGDGSHPVTIDVQDSQSDTNRAAQVAGDLITNGKADFMMAAASPDTVNPVADQSEALGCPCLTVDAPMEPYYFGRGGTPDKGFKWTYHLFWGFDRDGEGLLRHLESNGDQQESRDHVPERRGRQRLPRVLHTGKRAAHGFTMVDPGPSSPWPTTSPLHRALQEGRHARSAPPLHPAGDGHLLEQSLQQSYHPIIFQAVKASLFPTAIEAIGRTRRWDGRPLLVPSDLPVQIVTHRRDLSAAVRRLRDSTEPAMDPAHHALRRLRVGGRRPQTHHQRRRQRRDPDAGSRRPRPTSCAVPSTSRSRSLRPRSKRHVPNVYVTPMWAGQWRLDPGGNWHVQAGGGHQLGCPGPQGRGTVAADQVLVDLRAMARPDHV